MLVSVIMSAYNCEKTVGNAILSIIDQTYKDIEIIIINDASTDNTLNEILKVTKNLNNIKVHSNKKNLGLAKSLNYAVNLSHGELLARMDSDDISYKNRIETQVKKMKLNSEIDVLGANADFFFKGKLLYKTKMATSSKLISNQILKKIHSSIQL